VLNSTSTDKSGRECGLRGVQPAGGKNDVGALCQTCAAFTDISGMLIKPDTVFVVANQELNGTFLPLFSSRGEEYYFYTFKAEKVMELLQKTPEKVVRIYSKNTYRTGFNLATRLWLGDYAATGQTGELKTFTELAKSSTGIERIGVLQADVDNMGAAFVSGFIREHAAENKYRYLTLSRTATLSRSLSIFFKYYLNDLLANGEFDLLAPPGNAI
jgi:CRISPR-associated protein Csm1